MMILGALSYNRKSYLPASLSTLNILPVHEFEGSFQPKPPYDVFHVGDIPYKE